MLLNNITAKQTLQNKTEYENRAADPVVIDTRKKEIVDDINQWKQNPQSRHEKNFYLKGRLHPTEPGDEFFVALKLQLETDGFVCEMDPNDNIAVRFFTVRLPKDAPKEVSKKTSNATLPSTEPKDDAPPASTAPLAESKKDDAPLAVLPPPALSTAEVMNKRIHLVTQMKKTLDVVKAIVDTVPTRGDGNVAEVEMAVRAIDAVIDQAECLMRSDKMLIQFKPLYAMDVRRYQYVIDNSMDVKRSALSICKTLTATHSNNLETLDAILHMIYELMQGKCVVQGTLMPKIAFSSNYL